MAVGSFKLPISAGGAGFTGEWTQEYYQSVYDSTVGAYVRPADWLSIDHLVTEGDQKIVMLTAVFQESNFHAFRVTTSTGNYRVDWGDGTVIDYASNTTAERNLLYSGYVGTESSRGYRQAVITITAVSGNLTSINMDFKHSQSGLQNGYSENYLDIRMSGAFFTSLRFSGGSGTSRSFMLERFIYVGGSSLTSLSSCFNDCYSLQSMNAFDTTNVGSFINTFFICRSLRTIPLLNTQGASSTTNMFNGCASLQTIPLLNTQNVLTMNGMFSGCVSLQTIPLLNTQITTNISSIFNSCAVLQTIPLLNTQNVTNITQSFNACVSLRTIPLLNTQSVINFNSVFFNCPSLQEIPALNLASTTGATDFASIFATCPSLSKISITGFKNSFSVASCKLSAPALVEIFNNLPTVTSKTITITNNWGASLLTTPEREIATNKGWSIVG
jgi:hypothetical protein